VTGDFAIGRIGDARFDAVILVLMFWIDGRGERDGEAAVGVENAFVLLLLGGAVGRVRLVARARVGASPPASLSSASSSSTSSAWRCGRRI